MSRHVGTFHMWNFPWQAVVVMEIFISTCRCRMVVFQTTHMFLQFRILEVIFFISCLQKMKSGELRELHELNFVGRVRYERTSAFREMLETAVRHDGYSLLETSLAADLLIANDFLKTSEGGEARRSCALFLVKLKHNRTEC